MVTLADTADATRDSRRGGLPSRPGLIVAFSGASPFSVALIVDKPLAIGRGGAGGALWLDTRLSRNHCEIAWTEEGWRIRDLGSRNGTFVDGEPVQGEVVVASPRVIRAAETLFLPCPDVSSFRPVVTEGSMILGSRLCEALAAVDRAAAGATLLLLGESGTGKELAAHRFRDRGPNAGGPFVAVNCATLPESLAERLLFGARRGVYSGATADTLGHVQAADGGVLFLDEASELGLAVQAKLLRVLETREVLPLGATQATRVDMRVCMATHGDLRQAVADGRFRADLYHRVAPPEVVLPPLRERADEIPYHVAAEIAGATPTLTAHVKLVEACLLRPWPGNVRELRRQIHTAAGRAAAEGAERVRDDHLSPSAGSPLGAASSPQATPVWTGRTYTRRAGQLTREVLERALADHDGNVSRAAKSLGMRRTQLYRELSRHAVERGTKDK